jgi:hypothetical protein
MSTQALQPSSTTEHDRVRKILTPTAIASAVVAIGFTAIGVFLQFPDDHHAHSPWEFYSVAAVVVLSAVVVYGIVIPRALRKGSAGRTALSLSLIATLVLVPAFWSGLPFVLGLGAALLGNAGRHAPTGAGKSAAALAFGLLSATGYVAICIFDTIDRAGML